MTYKAIPSTAEESDLAFIHSVKISITPDGPDLHSVSKGRIVPSEPSRLN